MDIAAGPVTATNADMASIVHMYKKIANYRFATKNHCR